MLWFEAEDSDIAAEARSIAGPIVDLEHHWSSMKWCCHTGAETFGKCQSRDVWLCQV